MITTIFAILAFLPLVSASAAIEPEVALERWSRDYLLAAPEIHSPIALSATLKTRNGEHFLSFRLTNISKEPISLARFYLPWGNPYAIGLAAFDTDGTPLRIDYPISDPDPEQKVRILPGQALDGDCRLLDRLDLRKRPKDRDLIVLWSYMFSHPDDQPLSVSTGAVVIPRAK